MPKPPSQRVASYFTRLSIPRLALLAITAVVLLYGVVYPNLAVLKASLRNNDSWTVAHYTSVLSQRSTIEALANSVILSVGTVVLCALVGVSLAFLFERYTFPGRQLFSVLAALPLVLPPLVGTIAFIFLLGESGILARVVQSGLGLQSPPWTLSGWPALLLFHTYTMYPFFYVLTGAGLRRIDASLAEAARSLGGNRFTVLIRVLLPQLTPSLVAAGLLTFMTSMASFSAPLFFGGGVRVLTLEIYSARQRGDAEMAITQTVVLAIISLTALIFFQRYEGTRRFVAAAMKGTTRQREVIRNGVGRAFATVAAIVFSIVLVCPVLTLVLVSFAREGSWTTQTIPAEYSVSNYVRLFSEPQASEVFINSFAMSAIAAVAALAWSFCVVSLIAGEVGSVKQGSRTNAYWRRFVSLLVLIPWALPGTVVAVSIAEAYGQPSLLLSSFVLVGTFWILPVVYFLRFMPLVVRAVQASREQIDPSLIEAAGSLGANAWRRFVRVTLPLVSPGAVAGTLLAFVIALGEYVASVLVFVPINRPISIAIASEMRNFNLGLAAAYGVVLIGIIAIVMVAAGRLERLRG
jgi:iron(III) transport system permease protein